MPGYSIGMRLLAPVVLALALAACASQPKPAVTAPPPAAMAGMDQLLGQAVESATRLLGNASMDRREGPARQVQFAGACVLDLFYYPKGGPAPVATHASARLPDGRPLAPGDCLSLLLKGRRG